MNLKTIKNFFINLIFPENYKCIFCGRDIQNFDEQPYCDDCLKEIVLNDGNRCVVCDEPILNESLVCDNCQKHKRFFKKAYCPFVYDGLVKKAILRYKDSNERYLSKSFAKLIVQRLQKDKVKIDVVTFVPLTDKKRKTRTFDQAKLLASEISSLLGCEFAVLFKKEKESKGQKFLNYKERQQNMVGMYSFCGSKLKNTKNVLIVDDIITTCATVNYCAGLISNKVNSVYVCAIARNKLKHK